MKMEYEKKLKKWSIPFLVKENNGVKYLELHPICCLHGQGIDYSVYEKEDYEGHIPSPYVICIIEVNFIEDIEELSKDFDNVKLIINFKEKNNYIIQPLCGIKIENL